MIEFEFLTFEDVSISTTGLTRTGRNASKNSTGFELLSKLWFKNSILVSVGELGLSVTGDLLTLSSSIGFFLLLLVEFNIVLAKIPKSERIGINGDNGVLDDGLGSDELVVGGIVDDIENLGLSSDGLRSPGEVTSINTEGSEFVVGTSGSNWSNSSVTELGVGGLSSEFELSLLLMDWHTAGGSPPLVS